MTFMTQAEFVEFLRQQTEENYAFAFKQGGTYPLTVTLKRTPNRLIVTEV